MSADQPTDPQTMPATDEPPAAKPTRRAALFLFGFIILLIVLHLIGDRLTPYSNQGRIHAYVIGIAPEVGGTVETIQVRNNQLVKRGQPLFTLGPEQYDIAAQKARADLSATVRELAGADEAIKVAQAGLVAAQAGYARALADSDRSERIYKEDPGAISVRQVEMARATAAQSHAQVVAAVAQIEQAQQARGEVGDNNDRLVAARSALEKAQLDVTRTTVRAPGDGLITDLRTDRGYFAGPGTPVMTFIAVHDGWATIDMTENNLGHVRPGDPAEVTLDVMPGSVLHGHVRSIGYGVSTSGTAAPGQLPDIQNNRDWLRQPQRFPVIIDFDRAELERVAGLREGGQAAAIIYTGSYPIMNALGWLYIRLMTILSYAY
jgi:multidrug resistance efflux pump